MLYRSDQLDDADPQFAEALEQTKRDPELRSWFEQHRAFQQALREKFERLPVPPDLKEKILAQNKIVRPTVWWGKTAWLAAAAGIVLAVGWAAFWSKPQPHDRFADYRRRMVRTALRDYRMDLVTNNLNQIRLFMKTNGAPADYVLSKSLEHLSATGGGLIPWRDNRVAMVCFDRGDKQMLFLFVIARSAIRDAPPENPEWVKINDLMTAGWSQEDKTYLLAGPETPESLRKYLVP